MFICTLKTKVIPPFFLEILQRYCKLVILGTLSLPGYGQQKLWYQLVEDVYLYAKNQIYPSFLSWNITKILQTYHYASPTPSKTIILSCRKLWCLSKNQKISLIPHFFLDIKLQRILQSDLPVVFSLITWEPELEVHVGLLVRKVFIFSDLF